MTFDEHLKVIRDGLRVCPYHRATDCTPLLNGCSRLTAAHRSLDLLEAELNSHSAFLDRLETGLAQLSAIVPKAMRAAALLYPHPESN